VSLPTDSGRQRRIDPTKADDSRWPFGVNNTHSRPLQIRSAIRWYAAAIAAVAEEVGLEVETVKKYWGQAKSFRDKGVIQ
jgi:hypothetical protein